MYYPTGTYGLERKDLSKGEDRFTREQNLWIKDPRIRDVKKTSTNRVESRFNVLAWIHTSKEGKYSTIKVTKPQR